MNESSIFLIGKKNDKYEFNDFPKSLYVDTCFWNEVYGNTNSSYRRECSNFLEDCVSNNVQLLTSGIVNTEMKHVVKVSMMQEAIKNLNIDVHRFRYRDGNTNYKEVYQEILKIDAEFPDKISNEVNRVIKEVGRVSSYIDLEHDEEFDNEVDKVLKLTKYIMGSYDAEHTVLSHAWMTNSIATTDGDYWPLDNANIFVPPKSEYRNKRLGRRNILLPYDENKY